MEVEVVGHGGNEARLPCAGRAIQQVPTFPCLARLLVVLLPTQEQVEALLDSLLQLRLHGERLERGRMVESHRSPDLGVPTRQTLMSDGVNLDPFFFVRLGLVQFDHSGQVGVEDGVDMSLVEVEQEVSNTNAPGTAGLQAGGRPAKDVLVGEEPPAHHALVTIEALVVVTGRDAGVVLVDGNGRAEAGGCGLDGEVDLGGDDDLVGHVVVVFVDGDGELGGEAGEEAADEGRQPELNAFGEEVLDDGAGQGEVGCHGHYEC